MKLIAKNDFKAALYFNMILHVPENVKFIAADADGTLIGFEQEPKSDENWNFWDNPTGSDMFEIGTVDLEGIDWRSTLIAV